MYPPVTHIYHLQSLHGNGKWTQNMSGDTGGLMPEYWADAADVDPVFSQHWTDKMILIILLS